MVFSSFCPREPEVRSFQLKGQDQTLNAVSQIYIKFEWIISYVSIVLFTRGLIILTVFIPIRYNWLSFTIGTLLIVVCLMLYSISMLNFLSTDMDEQGETVRDKENISNLSSYINQETKPTIRK